MYPLCNKLADSHAIRDEKFSLSHGFIRVGRDYHESRELFGKQLKSLFRAFDVLNHVNPMHIMLEKQIVT